MALYSAAAAVLEGLERGAGGVKALVYHSRFPVGGAGGEAREGVGLGPGPGRGTCEVVAGTGLVPGRPLSSP